MENLSSVVIPNYLVKGGPNRSDAFAVDRSSVIDVGGCGVRDRENGEVYLFIFQLYAYESS